MPSRGRSVSEPDAHSLLTSPRSARALRLTSIASRPGERSSSSSSRQSRATPKRAPPMLTRSSSSCSSSVRSIPVICLTVRRPRLLAGIGNTRCGTLVLRIRPQALNSIGPPTAPPPPSLPRLQPEVTLKSQLAGGRRSGAAVEVAADGRRGPCKTHGAARQQIPAPHLRTLHVLLRRVRAASCPLANTASSSERRPNPQQPSGI